MQDDADLLNRFSRDASNEAFAELVRRHINLVYATALRQLAGDSHLAKDVAQSVFVDLARKARTVARHPVLARWLYTSTHHAAAKAVRSEQRRRSREGIALAMHEAAHEPTRDAEWARLRPYLDEALRVLNQRDSDAILMRFFEARSFAEIGGKLGLNENAARMRVDRALEKLREALTRRGITSTTVAITVGLSSEAAVAAPAGLAASITQAALASAAGGGATTASLIQFMSTTKLGIGAAAVLLSALMWLGEREYREAKDARAALGSAERAYALELQQIHDLRGQVDAAVRSQEDLQRTIAIMGAGRATTRVPAKESAGDASANAGAKRTSAKPTPATSSKLMGDLQVWFKGLAEAQFGPFFRNAGFSPEQQARMLDLLTLQKTLDLGAVATSLRPDTVTSDQITQELQGFLAGLNVQQEYQDYLRTSNLRPVATALAANLAYSDSPLTAEQGNLLTQILAANCAAGQPLGPLTVNWEAALAQAQSVLSAPQLAVLQSEVALVLAAGGINGTSFHPAGTFGGWGENAPSFAGVTNGTGK